MLLFYTNFPAQRYPIIVKRNEKKTPFFHKFQNRYQILASPLPARSAPAPARQFRPKMYSKMDVLQKSQ